MVGSNIELLTRVAEALSDLRERLMFIGGCATALLITDPGGGAGARDRGRGRDHCRRIPARVSPARKGLACEGIFPGA
jgi:hypothetical protein